MTKFDELSVMDRKQFSEWCYKESIHCHNCPFTYVSREVNADIDFATCEDAFWKVLQGLKEDATYRYDSKTGGCRLGVTE